MDSTRPEAVAEALAGAGICTWVWDVNAPDSLDVYCVQDTSPRDIRCRLGHEEWQLLQSQFTTALDDDRTFETTVVLRFGDDTVRKSVFRGSRKAGPDGRFSHVSGVCWYAVDVARTTEQTQWAPLAKLSHELRSPLTAILHVTAHMQGNNPVSVPDDAIAEIEHNARFMLRVIEDMLDAFRSGEPQATHEPEIVSTSLFLDQLVPLASERASLKGLGFKVCCDDDFPAYFWAKPVELRRVLQNLIDNAIKFTERGEVSMALRTAGERTDPRLFFDVIDTGPGIGEQDIERIFVPFEQGHRVQHPGDGLGLGLALSRQLARVLDGDLQVDSVQGDGSRFRLKLPFQEVSVEQRASLEKPHTDETTSAGEQTSVLLVEDHPLLSKHTGRELADLGCCVDVVANAQDALAAVEQRVPDVVILDLDLPDMSGYDLCRLMVDRYRAEKCRYVAYSGSDDIADRQAAEAAGFHAFFVKPSSARELLGI